MFSHSPSLRPSQPAADRRRRRSGPPFCRQPSRASGARSSFIIQASRPIKLRSNWVRGGNLAAKPTRGSRFSLYAKSSSIRRPLAGSSRFLHRVYGRDEAARASEATLGARGREAPSGRSSWAWSPR
jgi:hypothetical protein